MPMPLLVGVVAVCPRLALHTDRGRPGPARAGIVYTALNQGWTSPAMDTRGAL
ncbi:hypothetical protein ACFV2H_34675 [Streptomyces sp. NPDC059629]|uniref:hypothetical protein n=1 Tax=Streptomyces sp. NPDC059629 TaxID=3346889 RepID=UPI0036B18FBC